EALFVRADPRDAVPVAGEGMSGAMIERIMHAADTEAATEARAANAAFETARRHAGVPVVEHPPGPGGTTACWRESTGRAEDVLARDARFADLVVFARSGLAAGAAMAGTAMMIDLEAVLFGSARPILLAPETPPATIGRTVAVAWDGGMEAARAVTAAMPLLIRAETVHLLTAEPQDTRSAQSERLADYLACHGIAARVTRFDPAGEPVGAALMARASQAGADLVVMGGYGHSRVRELILGGTTRYVLGHAGLPVLMAH
ncbi:MAG TPA: universal stress protein, partial [Arenibaculum sp.]|nr:universal stress protein [Arenibaculum sp.]